MNLGLVIVFAALAALAAMFIRHANEQDRAYGPLSRDDFDQIPDGPAQVARVAGPPPCPEDRPVLAPDNASSEPETDAAPGHSLHVLNHVEVKMRFGQPRYTAVCICGDRMPGLHTKEGCGAWIQLHARRKRLSEAWSVDALFDHIESGRPVRVEPPVTSASKSVPVAARPASPWDRYDLIIEGVRQYRNLPEPDARRYHEAAIDVYGPELVELVPALTT